MERAIKWAVNCFVVLVCLTIGGIIGLLLAVKVIEIYINGQPATQERVQTSENR